MEPNPAALRLRAQRTVCRRALTLARQELEDLLNKSASSTDLRVAASLLTEKMEKLHNIDNEFINSITELEESGLEEELQRAEEYMDGAQRQLYRAKAILLESSPVATPAPASIADSAASELSSKSPTVNLPQLELATFDGDTMKWRPFLASILRHCLL